MPIDFQDTIRSTRADGKLMDVSALEGAFIKTLRLDGDTLVLDYQMADGTEATERFLGAKQPLRFDRIAATTTGTPASLTAAVFGAGIETQYEVVTIPANRLQNAYIGLWQEADGIEMTGINILGNNLWSQFLGPIALEVGGEDGYYWHSNRAWTSSADLEVRMLFDSELKVFRRYSGARLDSRGNTFDAADFMGATGQSSLRSDIEIVNLSAPFVDQQYRRAFAVPADTPDIIQILQTFGFIFDHFVQYERQPGTIQIGGDAYKVWRSTRLYGVINFSLPFRIVQQESERN